MKKLYAIVGLKDGIAKYTDTFFSEGNSKLEDDNTILNYINQYKELAVGTDPINQIIIYIYNGTQFKELTSLSYNN